VPELPWVSKSREGIVTFTEEVMADAVEIEFSEEEGDEGEDEGEDEEEGELEEINEGQIASSSQLVELEMPNREDVRKFLRLDDDINERLNKLLKK
jgi:hypothetical protein